ncbi:amino acid dehydrogenase, partial [Shouchella clausii]|nr:amino acid dehydrogenase [Shouchella clausii]
QAVSSAQERLKTSKGSAEKELGNWEEWRTLAEEIRSHTLNHIDFYLHQLSENVEKAG